MPLQNLNMGVSENLLGTLVKQSPLRAMREAKEENSLLRLRGLQAMSLESDLRTNATNTKKMQKFQEALGKLDKSQYGDEQWKYYMAAGDLAGEFGLTDQQKDYYSIGDKTLTTHSTAKTKERTTELETLEGYHLAKNVTGSLPENITPHYEQLKSKYKYDGFDDDQLTAALRLKDEKDNFKYTTRDLPTDNGMVQKQESTDGGRTWSPIGTPYPRHKQSDDKPDKLTDSELLTHMRRNEEIRSSRELLAKYDKHPGAKLTLAEKTMNPALVKAESLALQNYIIPRQWQDDVDEAKKVLKKHGDTAENREKLKAALAEEGIPFYILELPPLMDNPETQPGG